MIRILILFSLLTSQFCFAESNEQKIKFQSHFFKKGTLVYSDDFNGDFNKGFWGAPTKDRVIKDGVLTISPKFKSKEEAIKKLKRDHHLGLGPVISLKKIPQKYVLHMRFKFVTDSITTGRPSFQIGHHMIILAYNKKGGYRLGLPGTKRKWFAESKADMKINEWVDLVIEYQEGKILLSVNGHSKVYTDKQVTMHNKKDKHGPRFTFKSKDGLKERIVFDYVRIWKAE